MRFTNGLTGKRQIISKMRQVREDWMENLLMDMGEQEEKLVNR